MKKYILLGTLVVLGVGSTLTYRNMIADLVDRFPGTDPKVASKAFRKMLRDALSGKNEPNMTYDQLDQKFLEAYAFVTSQ